MSEVCPFCRFHVPDGAVVCGHCGAEKRSVPITETNTDGNFVVGLIVAALAAGGGWYFEGTWKAALIGALGGLAVLCKGPVGFVGPLAVILPWVMALEWQSRRDPRSEHRLFTGDFWQDRSPRRHRLCGEGHMINKVRKCFRIVATFDSQRCTHKS